MKTSIELVNLLPTKTRHTDLKRKIDNLGYPYTTQPYKTVQGHTKVLYVLSEEVALAVLAIHNPKLVLELSTHYITNQRTLNVLVNL